MESIKSLYGWLLPYQIRSQIHILRSQAKYQNVRHHNNNHLFSLFDKYQSLFIHIPKTGGVSVYSSLWSSKESQIAVESMGHFTARDYEIIFGKDTFKDYFKFTFVRNPWGKVLSSYQFLKRGGFNSRDKAWAQEHLSKFDSFDDFVTEWINTRNIYRALHFIPQYEFLKSSSGEIRIDFIGRLESIEIDFNTVKSKLGIDCQLKHYNKSNYNKVESSHQETSYRKFYTPETRDIIAHVYRNDIEIFDYIF